MLLLLSLLEGGGGRRRVRSKATRASTRLAGVERWWITAMEMAKSKVECGCGRERVSARRAVWGVWRLAILIRVSDLT